MLLIICFHSNRSLYLLNFLLWIQKWNWTVEYLPHVLKEIWIIYPACVLSRLYHMISACLVPHIVPTRKIRTTTSVVLLVKMALFLCSSIKQKSDPDNDKDFFVRKIFKFGIVMKISGSASVCYCLKYKLCIANVSICTTL